MADFTPLGRRSLLAGAGAAGALMITGTSAQARPRDRCVPPLNPPLEERVLNPTATTGDPAAKWHPDGTVRKFSGLTFVSPLDEGAFKDAMIKIRSRIRDRPLGRLYGLLPPDTYHVTIVQYGPVDNERTEESWPSTVPLDMSIPGVAREFTRLLADASLPQIGDIRLTPFEIGKQSKTSGIGIGFRVDERDRERLVEFELAVGEVLGLRAPRDNDYRWHATIGYKLYQPTDRELVKLDQWRDEFFALLPEELILRRHQCNIFDNMAGFPALLEFE